LLFLGQVLLLFICFLMEIVLDYIILVPDGTNCVFLRCGLMYLVIGCCPRSIPHVFRLLVQDCVLLNCVEGEGRC